jgi:hypothetical protein|nr:MAG TPA: hypothetical protein [Caudoviricetes sp.]
MTQKTDFEDIKAEILNRAKAAKAAKACTEQYSRAYKSETLQELCSVIKDNFNWCFNNKVITSNLLMQYREDFAQNDIFINISVRSGFLLCDNAYCTSHCIIECKLSNNAIYRVKSTNTVYYSSDNINFIKQ